jgi:hypothetical protein
MPRVVERPQQLQLRIPLRERRLGVAVRLREVGTDPVTDRR